MSHDTRPTHQRLQQQRPSRLDCCLHAPPYRPITYRAPTLLSVFCPKSRTRVDNKAGLAKTFPRLLAPSEPRKLQPTPSSSNGSECARSSTLELLMMMTLLLLMMMMMIFTRTNIGNRSPSTTTTLASYVYRKQAIERAKSFSNSSLPAKARELQSTT